MEDMNKDEMEYQYVEPEEAIKTPGVHLLDLREKELYEEGHIKGSEHCPIFPLDDETLVDEMKKYAADHLMDTKKIYLLCKAGIKGAAKATAVLKSASIEPSRLYTIKGGAKAVSEIHGAFVKD